MDRGKAGTLNVKFQQTGLFIDRPSSGLTSHPPPIFVHRPHRPQTHVSNTSRRGKLVKTVLTSFELSKFYDVCFTQLLFIIGYKIPLVIIRFYCFEIVIPIEPILKMELDELNTLIVSARMYFMFFHVQIPNVNNTISYIIHVILCLHNTVII